MYKYNEFNQQQTKIYLKYSKRQMAFNKINYVKQCNKLDECCFIFIFDFFLN